jgi:hypothetical protein
MLQARDLIPHFTVTRLSGGQIDYGTLWHRKNLVLVVVPDADDPDAVSYTSAIASALSASQADESECVATSDRVAGLGCPALAIADRWGEVVHVASGQRVSDLPPVQDVVEWIDYARRRCPECEGEVR